MTEQRGRDERLAGQRGGPFPLGEVDERPRPGPLPPQQGEGDGGGGVHAPDRIAVRDPRLERLVLAVVSGQRCQSAHQLDDRAEPDEIAIRPALPEGGHGNEDDVGPHRPQLVEPEAKFVEDVGPVVLDDDVAMRDQPEEGVAAALVGQVEDQRLLVAVVLVEVEGAVPRIGHAGLGHQRADVVPRPG